MGVMTNLADISGAFVRPNLVDYLMLVEHDRRDASLHIYVGQLEVGLLGVENGSVVHAEMPGAGGDAALSLLLRLSNSRVLAEAPQRREPNVSRPWRELASESQLSSSPGRPQRLAQIRAELAELEIGQANESGVYELNRGTHEETRERKIVCELLSWVVVEAYLEGDREHARELASRCQQLHSGELLCTANLERLRLRLLEDEIAAEVAEVEE